MTHVRIALIGDHNPAVLAHQAIPVALDLAATQRGVAVAPTWVATETIGAAGTAQLDAFDGVWCVPASPYRSTTGALAAIRVARETGRPFLGTCGGFQHALLEYAHNVLGLRDAAHAETDPDAPFALVAPLACALVEQADTITFTPGSRLAQIYGTAEAHEGYHCRYGLNGHYASLFADGPLAVSGRDAGGEVRAMELTSHPFFFLTLYQPERSALRNTPHPLITAFVAAVAERAKRATPAHPAPAAYV